MKKVSVEYIKIKKDNSSRISNMSFIKCKQLGRKRKMTNYTRLNICCIVFMILIFKPEQLLTVNIIYYKH